MDKNEIRRIKKEKNIRIKLSEKHENIEMKGSYINARTKISFRCKKCGNEWLALPLSVINGNGCVECNKVNKKIKGKKEFYKYIYEQFDNIEVIGEYVNESTKVKLYCKKCGHIWDIAPTHMKNRAGCPKCLGKIKKSNMEFQEELEKCNSNISLLTEYIGALHPVKCRCDICNYEWEIKHAGDLLRGHGCPICCHTGTSYFEQVIYETFKMRLGEENVLHRDKKIIGKELDIFVPKLNLAIEPGGWFWHKKRIKKDLEKLSLCKGKNIELIIIYDSYYDKEKPFDDCIICRCDFGIDKNEIELITFINGLLDRFNIENLSDLEFKKIKIQAVINTKRMTTEEFKNELKYINSDIEVVGEYTGKHSKVKCRCKKCGYVRCVQAKSLLNGIGCPNCSGVRKKTHQEFVEEMKIINKNIIFLSEYEAAHVKVKCKCIICGNEWQATPRHLLDGRKCPICSKVEGNKKRIKAYIERYGSLLDNNPALCEEWSNKNPLPPSEYTVNSGEIVWWKCSTCGNEWQAKIMYRNKGQACKKCILTKKKKNNC